MDWLWIPITLSASLFQSVRTALQKFLRGKLSTNGSTFTRFAFGAPLALVYLVVLKYGFDFSWPNPPVVFFGWVIAGALAQIIATALLIYVLGLRNFPVGIAYSKTEIVQAAIFGFVFLGDTLAPWGIAAIGIATIGVMMFSATGGAHPWRAMILGLAERPALIGMASGGFFSLSAIGFRAAALSLALDSPFFAASYALAFATVIQTVLLGAYLAWREKGELTRVFVNWRIASLAGITSVLGSACWFTAMTIQTVAYVRTLALVELVFTFLLSRYWFKEKSKPAEIAGIIFLIIGIAMILNLT